jgi:hypothetical protein
MKIGGGGWVGGGDENGGGELRTIFALWCRALQVLGKLAY